MKRNAVRRAVANTRRRPLAAAAVGVLFLLFTFVIARFGYGLAANDHPPPQHDTGLKVVGIVLLVPLPLIIAFAAVQALAELRPGRRFRRGHCQTCGYDLRASARRCPECGQPPRARRRTHPRRPRDTP